MIYERTIRNINIAHFNGEEEYKAFQQGDYLRCLHGTHGHSLVVVVRVLDDAYVQDNQWVIDDRELAHVILTGLADKNLSVHPWFNKRGLRATTENIVKYIRELLLVENHLVQTHMSLSVRVYENSDIYAEE